MLNFILLYIVRNICMVPYFKTKNKFKQKLIL